MLALALGALGLPAHAQLVALPLVDEGAADASWQRYRRTLSVALERQDRQFVLATLDARVRNGEGRPDGIAAFRKAWDFDHDPQALFTELRELLSLGSVYVREAGKPVELCAPYVPFKWPEEVDPLNHGAVLIRDALIKAAPSQQSATITRLGQVIVGVDDWEVEDLAAPGARQKWVKVVTPAGAGYLPEEQIRSAVEHRACFRRSAQGWKLTSLFAGD